MTSSSEILILSLIYSAFLNVLFGWKKHVVTPETTAFSKVVLWNFFGIVCELACIFSIQYFGTENIVPAMICRMYLIYLAIFTVLFFDYQYTISVGFEYYNAHYKRIHRRLLIVEIIAIIVSLLLPITLHLGPTGIYFDGLAYTVVYAVSLLGAISAAFFMIKALKNKTTKIRSYLPLIFIIIGFVACWLIQQQNHKLMLLTVLETFILVVMYFTLENPDVRIIEELKISKSEAEKANKAKTDFLSSMSHEIRTPLNAIVGFSEDIKSREDEASVIIREDAGYILEAANTLLEIIGNILDINKIESSKLEIVELPYDFKSMVKSLAQLSAVRIGSKPVKLNAQISDKIPDEIIGDEVHVKEIINNLLSNAIKYTDAGEVKLICTCENSPNKTVLHITVTDTGKGIKKENINKLFGKFERLDTEINSTIEGTGLGLAITKSLVDLMDGQISVESNFGSGSTFRVTIPQKVKKVNQAKMETIVLNEGSDQEDNKPKLDAAPKANDMAFPNKNAVVPSFMESSTPKVGKRRVLVVDDNKLNIKVAERVLSSIDYDVYGCMSGEECLKKINDGESYDIILMDIMMPEMSGEECLKKLKEMPEFKIPVIAFTADAVAGAKEKYLSEGFGSYVAKPFNKEQITEAIERLL